MTVRVTIVDVNEAPTLLYRTSSLDENALGGTELGTPSAYDPDHDTVLEFELLSVHAGGEDQDDAFLFTFFAVDNATGTVTLTDAGAENLDYERMPNYTLSVVVHDNGIPTGSCVWLCTSTTALATVLINDINVPPYFTAANYTLSIDENEAIGTSVGLSVGTTSTVARCTTS